MAGKQLKSVSLHQVAAEAWRSLPLAVAPRERRTVLVNVKMAEESAIAMAKKATAEGVTQKQFICRALVAAGVPMDPLDLEDRTPRRRAAA
jgi:hypothetical protein